MGRRIPDPAARRPDGSPDVQTGVALSMFTLFFVLTSPASAAEWRGAVGAHISQSSNGAMDVGWRAGDWQAELLTDTVDVRWRPEDERGRAWVAGRVQLGAAGLMIAPWADGAPAPGSALAAFYAGAEGGRLWYLPRGLYGGFDARAQHWWFRGVQTTDRAVPAAQARSEGAGILGWWTTPVQAWVRVGAHGAPDAGAIGLDTPIRSGTPLPRVGADAPAVRRVQPFAHLTLTARPPDRRVTPRAELRVGWTDGADAISRTRLGGNSPYAVPLSGAGWAEFWVDRYAAVRAGPGLDLGAARVDAVVDAAIWQGTTDWGGTADGTLPTHAVGIGLLSRFQPGRLTVDVDAGVAPWLPRRDGLAWSVWTLVSVPWDTRANASVASESGG